MYAATKSLRDENGDPLLWELKPLTTREQEEIRDECIVEVPVPGKRGMYRPKTNVSKLTAKMICASVVYPDLNIAELQDSYGVKTPEDLVREMVPSPGEYAEFAQFIQEFSGFTDFEDEVNEVKNG